MEHNKYATNKRGFLFCRNDDGARAASILTTVIKTAEENGLYPDGVSHLCLQSCPQHLSIKADAMVRRHQGQSEASYQEERVS